jgi:hypothetical protein
MFKPLYPDGLANSVIVFTLTQAYGVLDPAQDNCRVVLVKYKVMDGLSNHIQR